MKPLAQYLVHVSGNNSAAIISMQLSPLFRPLLHALALISFLSLSVNAAPGELDISFGNGGKVITDFNGLNDEASAVTVQLDGKIVVVGDALSAAGEDFGIVRYNADGSLDTSFGAGGKVVTAFSLGRDRPFDVKTLPNGGILVVGWASVAGADVAISKYNPDGSLDTTFGSGGKVTVSVGSNSDYGTSLIVRDDGKFLVAGYTMNNGNEDILLLQFNPSGTLDSNFGTGGKVTSSIGTGNDQGYGIALQADGKIVVAGDAHPGPNFGAVRFNANGSLDTSFGTSGKVIIDVDGSSDFCRSVAIQSDGKILMSGSSLSPITLTERFATVRLNTNGTLDTTFGSGGKVLTVLPGQARGVAVGLQSNGKILLGGYCGGVSNDFCVVRYNSNGTLDDTFGTGGKTITNFRGGSDVVNWGRGLAIQPDGQILLAGYSVGGGQEDFAVARFHGDFVNQTPVARPDAYHLPETQLTNLPVLSNDSDPNIGQTLTIIGSSQGTYGVVSLNNGSSIAYTPGSEWNGADSFTYTISDGSGGTATTTVTLQNSAPVAQEDTSSAETGQSILIQVLANDSDADSDALTIKSVQPDGPGGSTASIEGTAIRFNAGQSYAGKATIPYTIGDGHGGGATGIIVVTVKRAGPAQQVLHIKGAPVPRAETDPKIAPNALWRGFEAPAINDSGAVAYVGRWRAVANRGSNPTPSQNGTGIFLDDKLIIKEGEIVPGAGMNGLPADATVKSIKAPVLDNNGRLALIASIRGTGALSTNATVIVSNGYDGNLQVIAREGSQAPGTGGATYRVFSSVSISEAAPAEGSPATGNSGTIFTAVLLPGSGTPTVISANDMGVWMQPSNTISPSVVKLVREGDPALDSTIKSFVLHKALSGSPGHGRGQTAGKQALLHFTLADKTQALAFAEPGGITALATPTLRFSTPSIGDQNWSKLNFPSPGDFGSVVTVLGTLEKQSPFVSSSNAKGIFQTSDNGSTWAPIARITDPAPGMPSGVNFSAFTDPVNSLDGHSLAFVGGTEGLGVLSTENDGIWWKSDSLGLVLVAREGAQPIGAPAGAMWKSFASLAMGNAEAGPIFTAVLHKGVGTAPGPGGITSATDFALYATTANGTVHELMREGQPLAGKTVRAFAVLKAVSGSAGVTRSFNANGQIVALVTFTDATTAIVRVDLP